MRHRHSGPRVRYRTKRNNIRYRARPIHSQSALKFWDIKTKKSFNADKYTIVPKGGRRFAVTTAPSGIKSYRVIGKGFGK